ncbi:enolase C-terminal domain-like protein [Paraburkholderia humisilvae]|uniref:D(-)-tartrate dehydratase n=1 Tax=Paraburkholderia humisilvae TaxID=627669 RepID=A0A6J5E606_9BURK|nr:enolase C-terminal domain-like protein [Paraburkholderia humisilvae]CAB3760736.1 D(-)-tartrate dehydratase [Paraburkholderia humisilvae]
MRITAVREISVPLEGNVANALVSFAEHDVSLVALHTDVIRNGKPLIGYAFDSIGRFAQGGILRDRMIPRLVAAAPDSLLDASGAGFDPETVLKTVLRNEKPGGHGDRAAAAGAIELAVWDLNAKLRDEPAHVTIARRFDRRGKAEGVDVYAAGGYYYPEESTQRLADEFDRYREMGFDAFKMKIGGASLVQDLARIEAALSVAGAGQRLAVDANGRFDLDTALAYAEAIAPYDLRWYEEIGDPLDFDLNRQVAQAYAGRIATGENLFSLADVKNLALFGGMRPGKDVFQMDAGLAYGLTEYARMIELIENRGFDRAHAYPHGGHLINLHIAVGLELGGCEAYPGVFQPFGGYPAGCGIGGGLVRPTDAAGFGLEEKDGLRPWLERLAA